MQSDFKTVDFIGTGQKFDTDKPRMDLVPAEGLEEVAKAFTFGAVKYGDHNWRGGIKWTRLGAASLRHIYAWLRGEDYDSESGLHHLSHAICCLLMLVSYEKMGARVKELDDRWKSSVQSQPQQK